MHNKIDEIKKNDSSPKVLKNLFSKEEINKFLKLYQNSSIFMLDWTEWSREVYDTSFNLRIYKYFFRTN